MFAQKLNISLASYPRRKFDQALIEVMRSVEIPVAGLVDTRHVQLCPQNFGILDVEMIECLRSLAPNMQFRLHANVRVLASRHILDVIDFAPNEHPYWNVLKAAHRATGAPVYSAHAGHKAGGSMAHLIDQAKRFSDFMGCPVAVEGHYPSRNETFLMSSWDEWERVLRADIPFVVDVSHAQIVAHLSRCRNDDLVREMLASPNCLEIHLSGNDGRSDRHCAMTGDEWWWPLLDTANPKATWFYEGIVKRIIQP